MAWNSNEIIKLTSSEDSKSLSELANAFLKNNFIKSTFESLKMASNNSRYLQLNRGPSVNHDINIYTRGPLKMFLVIAVNCALQSQSITRMTIVIAEGPYRL